MVVVMIASAVIIVGGILGVRALRPAPSSHPAPSSAPATANCSQLRDAAVRMYALDQKGTSIALALEMFGPRIADATIKRCTEDKWPPEVVACYGAARTVNAFEGCVDKLPREQVERLVADTSPKAIGMIPEPQATASAHPDPACAAAVAAAIDAMVASGSTAAKQAPAEERAGISAELAKAAPLMKTAIIRVCSDDKWPPQVIACFGKARADVDLSTCAAQLPDDARAHFNKAIAEAVGAPDVVP